MLKGNGRLQPIEWLILVLAGFSLLLLAHLAFAN
jgi:hypothetical protein